VDTKFFKTPSAFTRWLVKHHASSKELWVGFYKKATGRPSITWPESVDEALCYGWIDGVRRSVDAVSYAIRFTPRRPESIWSAVNRRRARVLICEGRMQPTGLDAFRRRSRTKPARYSYENRPQQLPPKLLGPLRANARAWAFYRAQPPWYRRTSAWWVVSAKKDETRLRRLAQLIACSARGKTIMPLTRKPSSR